MNGHENRHVGVKGIYTQVANFSSKRDPFNKSKRNNYLSQESWNHGILRVRKTLEGSTQGKNPQIS